MELLSGWKEIAEHLHLGVRTAQRWERLGLPVRRVSESGCSPVVAIPDELELWARRRDAKSDADVIAAKQSRAKRSAELRQSHIKTHRRTRTLLRQLSALGKEQEKLLADIRVSLYSPRKEVGKVKR